MSIVLKISPHGECFGEKEAQGFTEDDLEAMASSDKYKDNAAFMKLDANGYSSPQEALNADYYDCENEDYYIISFGF